MYANLEPAREQLFKPADCYKPRRLSTYVYTPRTKVPPGWQAAQRFVRALVIDRIGQAPYYFGAGGLQAHRRYYAVYCKHRAAYMDEDFPINP
jgi:hypothetical protein